MKKSTKGAIAAAAAAVLLLGGAGTLAFWSDSETIPGGTVSSGELSLSEPECDADWVYAAGNANPGGTVGLIVPGDAISKECTFDIAAKGDNLNAELTTVDTVDITAAPAAPTFNATVAATYSGAGTAVTEARDGETVTATITVTFPYGDDTTVNVNDTQNVTATLDDIDITLVQTES